jgi:sensor domain CHASE-containing protein
LVIAQAAAAAAAVVVVMVVLDVTRNFTSVRSLASPGPDAPISVEGKRASHFENVYDFYKPNLSRCDV